MQGFEVPEVSAVQASQSLIPNLFDAARSRYKLDRVKSRSRSMQVADFDRKQGRLRWKAPGSKTRRTYKRGVAAALAAKPEGSNQAIRDYLLGLFKAEFEQILLAEQQAQPAATPVVELGERKRKQPAYFSKEERDPEQHPFFAPAMRNHSTGTRRAAKKTKAVYPEKQPADVQVQQRLVAELEQATAENKNMQLQLDDRQLQLDQAQVQLQKADEEKERLAGELAKKERELIELQLARAVALGAFFPSQIRNFAAFAPPDLVAAQIAIERNY